MSEDYLKISKEDLAEFRKNTVDVAEINVALKNITELFTKLHISMKEQGEQIRENSKEIYPLVNLKNQIYRVATYLIIAVLGAAGTLLFTDFG